MCANIRRVSSAISAVGAIEPGHLSALELQMILKIMFPTEDTLAIAAGVLWSTGIALADATRSSLEPHRVFDICKIKNKILLNLSTKIFFFFNYLN